MASKFIGRASRTAALIAAAALVTSGLTPAYAMARDPDGASASAPAKAQDRPAKKARKICVQTELTGTRLPRKTCKTRDQWIKEDGFDPMEDSGR